MRVLLISSVVLLAACGGASPSPSDAGVEPIDSGVAVDAGSLIDAGVDAGLRFDAGSRLPHDPDPFADWVVDFQPGASSGFGAAELPDIVRGPPHGEPGGSLDVVSLGKGGSIVLDFDDVELRDGPGVDLLVFENYFTPFWTELGVVAVSQDGVSWHEFACAEGNDAGFPGCAGTQSTNSAPDSGISATDPSVAGGNGFDLATVGLSHARFVRVRDTGNNAGRYGGSSGGFDLDAVSIVNGRWLDGGADWP